MDKKKKITSFSKELAKRIRLNLMEGTPNLAKLLDLTAIQSKQGEFTFITLNEWFRLEWPGLFDWEDCTYDEIRQYELFGAYVAWYLNFLRTVSSHDKAVVKRIDGETVGRTLKEVIIPPVRKMVGLTASISQLSISSFGSQDITACLSCALYTKSGTLNGVVVGWYTGTTSDIATKGEIEYWARHWGADKIVYVTDYEGKSYPLEVNDLGVYIPLALDNVLYTDRGNLHE